jgi:hypothetical protein
MCLFVEKKIDKKLQPSVGVIYATELSRKPVEVTCYDIVNLLSTAVASACKENEFRCANSQQCIPLQFVCNYVDDCGDNSDERSCGPGPVRIVSYRDSGESDQYTISWVRPQAGGGDIVSYTIKYRLVNLHSLCQLNFFRFLVLEIGFLSDQLNQKVYNNSHSPDTRIYI